MIVQNISDDARTLLHASELSTDNYGRAVEHTHPTSINFDDTFKELPSEELWYLCAILKTKPFFQT